MAGGGQRLERPEAKNTKKMIKIVVVTVAAISLGVQGVKPEDIYVQYKPDFEIDGRMMRAYESALIRHKKYMRAEKGLDVDQFKVLLKEEPKFFRIHFVPKRVAGKNDHLGSGGARADMMYAVDKTTYKVFFAGGGG